MKLSLYLCGAIFLLCLVTPHVAAIPFGTDISIHSQYITEDDSGTPNYTYSMGFAIDQEQLIWEKYTWEQANSSNSSSIIYLMNLTDGATQILATAPSQDVPVMV